MVCNPFGQRVCNLIFKTFETTFEFLQHFATEHSIEIKEYTSVEHIYRETRTNKPDENNKGYVNTLPRKMYSV